MVENTKSSESSDSYAPSAPPYNLPKATATASSDDKKAPAQGSSGGMYSSTSLKRWQTQNLDYNFYWAFTVLLGWFGVDYWYLGAPLTGLLKFITNMSTFGYWWFYDILNATFNRPTVELFGPTMPFFGTTGCAGARFRQANTTEDPERLSKHLNYIIYGLVLGITGIIGGDSFLLGNTTYAFIRLICLVTIIGAPIALIWWAYNLFNYVFSADYFINDAWYYLGAASPDGSKCPSFFAKLFSPITSLFSMITGIKFPTPESLAEWQTTLLSKPDLTASNVTELNKAFQIKSCPSSQKGGSSPSTTLSSTNTHLLSLLFAGTIGFVIVSSIILSLRRSYQNGNKKGTTTSPDDKQRGDQEDDDVPPQPRVSGVTPKDA